MPADSGTTATLLVRTSMTDSKKGPLLMSLNTRELPSGDQSRRSQRPCSKSSGFPPSALQVWVCASKEPMHFAQRTASLRHTTYRLPAPSRQATPLRQRRPPPVRAWRVARAQTAKSTAAAQRRHSTETVGSGHYGGTSRCTIEKENRSGRYRRMLHGPAATATGRPFTKTKRTPVE